MTKNTKHNEMNMRVKGWKTTLTFIFIEPYLIRLRFKIVGKVQGMKK